MNGAGEIVTMLLKEGELSKDKVAYAARVQSKLEVSKSLLDVLKELKFISDEQIKKALRANIGSVRIGDLLVELGHISEADLQHALSIQKNEKSKKRLGEILVAYNFIKEEKLLEILSLQLGFPISEPEFDEIDPELVSRASTKFYKNHNFIPIRSEGQAILIAFADPMSNHNIEIAKKFFGNNIIQAIASKKSIHLAIDRVRPERRTSLKFTKIDEVSVVEIVDSIILDAVKGGASDIHIEPMKDRLQVRFRQDGVLVPYKHLPLEIIPPLISRIKIMCEADIAEKRRHQGGRILFNKKGTQLDLRVSFYITVYGEKTVLRLLKRQSELIKIEDIGMAPKMLERFREDAIDRPSGVLMITGPTGSGKTTTVYSCINYLNNPQTSIITAEEPVEYIIDGIAQCSIDPKINLTFEETLRHIVRQDPDVIVIGEIRDTFSADIAVQAALTGHKVLTTFHTEDTIGGLVRLLNMDIDAFLISSTVVCVVAQRLLRRICPECKTSHKLSPTELRRLGYTHKDIIGANFMKGQGCPRCQHTGYKGRLAVFELLILEESVRDAILERKTSHQIRNISIKSTGLVTLLEDGIIKAASGLTTTEEVLRCLPRLQKPRPIVELRRLLGV